MTEVRERFAFIHALRGVASLLVVWSHLSGFWLLETGNTSVLQDAWYTVVAGPLHIYQNGGHLGVVLFFLISGYIISHTSLRESHGEFAIKRVMRILPPLIVATLVTWVLLQLSTAMGDRLFGINDGPVWHWLTAPFLIDGFLPGGRALDVTWTLVVEVVFYATTFVLLGLSRSRPVLALYAMLGIWAALTAITVGVPALRETANAPVVVYVGFLIAGRAIYLLHRTGARRVPVVVAGVLAIAGYCIFVEMLSPGFLVAPGGWSGVEPFVSYIYAFVIFIGLMLLAPRRLWQPFRFLGDISYSLYLLHLPVGMLALNLLDRTSMPHAIATLVAIAAALAVSWLAFIAVERPSQRAARHLLGRRSQRVDTQ